MTPDILAAITPIADAFVSLSIPYFIGCSVASSTHGQPRATNNIDLVAAIPTQAINHILSVLKSQHGNIDIAYVRQFAGIMNTTSLLDKAIQEAGIWHQLLMISC